MSEREIPVLKLGQDLVQPHGPQPVADETTRRLYESVEPALVQIKTDGTKAGTGFFTGDQDKIVTSASVVLGTNEQFVIGRDGRRYRAQVENIDDTHNIAVLSIRGQAPEHGTLTLDNGKGMKHDARVTTFGFPADLNTAYASPGYFRHYRNPALFLQEHFKSTIPLVAERLKNMEEDEKKEASKFLSRPLLETSTNMRKGYAGAPLVDLDGKVKGVNTMTNARDLTNAYFTPAEFAQKAVEGKDPKFNITYDHEPAEWAGQYLKDWRENQLTAGAETAFGVGIGYLGYRVANRLPTLTGLAVGVTGLSMLASDADRFLSSTDSRDSWKFGLASVADVGTAGGAFMSLVPKARGIGLAVMGAGIVGRLATDFIHNRWAIQDITRTDGVDRPPIQLEHLLKQ